MPPSSFLQNKTPILLLSAGLWFSIVCTFTPTMAKATRAPHQPGSGDTIPFSRKHSVQVSTNAHANFCAGSDTKRNPVSQRRTIYQTFELGITINFGLFSCQDFNPLLNSVLENKRTHNLFHLIGF